MIQVIKFRTGFNYDRDAASLACGFSTGSDTPTIQSAKEECDINEIVRRFGLTGQLPVNLPPILYGDFTEVEDFASALACVNDATERFMQLPAEFRFKFANDPQKFLNYCEARDYKGDRVNIEEMRKYGLAVPLPVAPVDPPPVRVEVVNKS